MRFREVAKDVVTSHCGVSETFFDTAWEVVAENYDDLVAQPKRERDLRDALGRPLGIAGPETPGAVRAIIIFVGAEKQLELGVSGAELLAAVNILCQRYEANERLTKEILNRINDLVGAESSRSLVEGLDTRTIDEESTKHARVWSNNPIRHGAPIDDAEFKNLEKQKATSTFKIFIVDRGDFEMGRVGEVFLSGHDMRSRFTDLHYRILVHALRNHHVAGALSIAQFAKHCWREGDALVADLESREAMVSRDAENKYRRVIMQVNKTLEAECGVVLAKAPKGEYHLSAHVPFAVIELPVQ